MTSSTMWTRQKRWTKTRAQRKRAIEDGAGDGADHAGDTNTTNEPRPGIRVMNNERFKYK
jgi:hypothetical protein